MWKLLRQEPARTALLIAGVWVGTLGIWLLLPVWLGVFLTWLFCVGLYTIWLLTAGRAVGPGFLRWAWRRNLRLRIGLAIDYGLAVIPIGVPALIFTFFPGDMFRELGTSIDSFRLGGRWGFILGAAVVYTLASIPMRRRINALKELYWLETG